jgi:CTP synthase (UTP-ammonia lyase)
MEILNDFDTSVKKALEEIDPNYMKYNGLVVCGTHSPHNVNELFGKIKWARENKVPFLGICFGHQLAAIEYATNVLKHVGATSEELYNPNFTYIDNNQIIQPEFIVVKRKEGLKVGLHDGETYWNNYEVISGFEDIWKKEDNFITCQFHPEYQSSNKKPHPLLISFLKYAKI